MSGPMIRESRVDERAASVARRTNVASTIRRAGRAVALTGVVLPLLLIGGLKFTQFEIEALKPLISSAPWLAWMYSVLGEARTSYLLGVVEITTAFLLIASPRF